MSGKKVDCKGAAKGNLGVDEKVLCHGCGDSCT
jgi:hypothetical protein